MKKIFLVLLFGFLFSGNTFAETKVLDRFHEKSKNGKSNMFTIYTLCIDGYKFITTQDYAYAGHGGSNAISTSVGTIQFMIAENGKMIPAKCD
jgi:hypothetical protein